MSEGDRGLWNTQDIWNHHVTLIRERRLDKLCVVYHCRLKHLHLNDPQITVTDVTVTNVTVTLQQCHAVFYAPLNHRQAPPPDFQLHLREVKLSVLAGASFRNLPTVQEPLD
ncbi:hypothetical protein J6590_075365 [Homalodisca vitripennis]|nr:hypothetical protein J6590_075365 [Homalodisca vitripennis]